MDYVIARALAYSSGIIIWPMMILVVVLSAKKIIGEFLTLFNDGWFK